MQQLLQYSMHAAMQRTLMQCSKHDAMQQAWRVCGGRQGTPTPPPGRAERLAWLVVVPP